MNKYKYLPKLLILKAPATVAYYYQTYFLWSKYSPAVFLYNEVYFGSPFFKEYFHTPCYLMSQFQQAYK